ncbi:enamine deaminase RidA [Mesorhizobium sp. L-8-10]|uniref:RidA family protein n=1 Tax=Mesorhizobium sp. L-8-10 TaxID=2744523 RepID=UPI0019269C16|nr:RidA family protein [Mesorhizobium sp. L-8-10]BCH31898.1 enamine deaminase RidA [Mesorhizobium sp. L-8-10]
MQRFNPSTMAPPVMDLYSQIAVSPAGARFAAISGQVAIDSEGALVAQGSHAGQARQCFLNIRHALEAIGATPADILQMRIHVVDHSPARIEDIFGAGRDIFGEDWPLCASTYIGVACLGLPDWLVEIDAIVVLSQ